MLLFVFHHGSAMEFLCSFPTYLEKSKSDIPFFEYSIFYHSGTTYTLSFQQQQQQQKGRDKRIGYNYVLDTTAIDVHNFSIYNQLQLHVYGNRFASKQRIHIIRLSFKMTRLSFFACSPHLPLFSVQWNPNKWFDKSWPWCNIQSCLCGCACV